MNAWLENKLEQSASINDWLSPKREEAAASLKAMPWPTRKTEAWKYTSLYALESADLSGASTAAEELLNISTIDSDSSIDLIFKDGVLVSILVVCLKV